ncbi:hypothetical protein P691DRAFT_777251 [Macrolepiota fuliginosa MF-IS2]|uniref:Uncharacterized protein n=1 Tax=Macrolepiota fuliginosa MF-IS2 TaxID=1400762 RepID=A0A9P5X9P1_9AGAR|nr:hypothetical protein P691DRAFT_777251 [Macrolepiota fuliginosa MF-IS2]
MFESKTTQMRLPHLATFATTSLLQGHFLFHDFTDHQAYHDHVVYSPHPGVLLALFAAHTVVQGLWLFPSSRYGHRLRPSRVRMVGGVDGVDVSAKDHGFDDADIGGLLPPPTSTRRTQEADTAEEFAALYILGNLCLSVFPLAFTRGNYPLCRLTLFITIIAQLYAIFSTLRTEIVQDSESFRKRNKLPQLIAKTRIGLGLLYLWKTWGAFELDMAPPTINQQILTFLMFLCLALASGPDPTLGFCVTISLYAVGIGPSGSTGWSSAFVWSATVIGVAVVVDWLFGTWSAEK